MTSPGIVAIDMELKYEPIHDGRDLMATTHPTYLIYLTIHLQPQSDTRHHRGLSWRESNLLVSQFALLCSQENLSNFKSLIGSDGYEQFAHDMGLGQPGSVDLPPKQAQQILDSLPET